MFTDSTTPFMVDLQTVRCHLQGHLDMSLVSCLSCTVFAGWCDDRKLGQSPVVTGGGPPKVRYCLFTGGEDGGGGGG